MAVADDVRDVGALSDDALDDCRGLPAIAALRAAGRVFKCPVFHVVKAVRSADSMQKTANSLASRCASQLLRAKY